MTKNITVRVPSPLHSYTGQARVVHAVGETVGSVLASLDKQYPGIRFRMIDEQDGIRQHIKLFVNQEAVPNLLFPIKSGDTLHIICALSGG